MNSNQSCDVAAPKSDALCVCMRARATTRRRAASGQRQGIRRALQAANSRPLKRVSAACGNQVVDCFGKAGANHDAVLWEVVQVLFVYAF